MGRKLPAGTAARMRRGGLFLLLLAYPVAGLALGWGYGAIEWFGQLSGGALLTVLLLSRQSARRTTGR